MFFFLRQICSSVAPLHPVLPALVEVYVNSILVPSTKAPTPNTNQLIDEEEIRKVFRNSLSHQVLKFCLITINRFFTRPSGPK